MIECCTVDCTQVGIEEFPPFLGSGIAAEVPSFLINASFFFFLNKNMMTPTTFLFFLIYLS